MTDDVILAEMAAVFQCLADAARLKIVNALLLTEMRVGDISAVTGSSQPSVSHHLQQLRQVKLVKFRRSGKAVLYSLDDDHIHKLFAVCRSHAAEPVAAAAPMASSQESDHAQS
ncbi:MAG: metalloregulator ArsR/SmtB family transcription factor [Victivallaceae bacterium]|nr:metalloregulator ArsR/SmtB family transcription factor [Victivallaceae bacterium]